MVWIGGNRGYEGSHPKVYLDQCVWSFQKCSKKDHTLKLGHPKTGWNPPAYYKPKDPIVVEIAAIGSAMDGCADRYAISDKEGNWYAVPTGSFEPELTPGWRVQLVPSSMGWGKEWVFKGAVLGRPSTVIEQEMVINPFDC